MEVQNNYGRANIRAEVGPIFRNSLRFLRDDSTITQVAALSVSIYEYDGIKQQRIIIDPARTITKRLHKTNLT